MCTIVLVHRDVVKERFVVERVRMDYATGERMRIPQKHLQELAHLLASRTPQEILLLLEDLLTPQERGSVAERWQILQALVRGTPQREIAKKLNTSIGKITRGSRVVQYGALDWKKLVGEMNP